MNAAPQTGAGWRICREQQSPTKLDVLRAFARVALLCSCLIAAMFQRVAVGVAGRLQCCARRSHSCAHRRIASGLAGPSSVVAVARADAREEIAVRRSRGVGTGREHTCACFRKDAPSLRTNWRRAPTSSCAHLVLVLPPSPVQKHPAMAVSDTVIREVRASER